MNKIVLDVGANYGQECEQFLKEGCVVYAFDPAPVMYMHLCAYFSQYPNFRPVPIGVDINNGWSDFGVGVGGGCSSIHDFNPNILEEWKDDVSRTDFNFIERVRIMTIRLDTFMELYNINDVDFLWIDAQGNDFNVLKSLGDKIRMIKEGKCEVSLNANLYKDVVNDSESVMNWLQQRGFDCQLVPHPHMNEADIIFKRG